MSNRKPIWDIIPEDKKEQCINDIIGFFQNERGEQIGIIAAQEILDVSMEKIMWIAYNKGITDAKKLLQDSFANINVDLDSLIQVNK